ncbi:hypothetical protein Aperf_G00000071656 [Anoplocephala perfoliata]
MSSTSSKNVHWGPSMLMGVQFIFKNKAIVAPDLPPRFVSFQNSKRIYEFNFETERKILKDYGTAEELERQKAEEQRDAKNALKDGKQEADEQSTCAVPQLTTIEPSKTEIPSTEPHAMPKPPSKVDPTILEDFESQASRDDPFVAAELGTINDLEELRDVLASMQITEPMNNQAKNTNMYESLKSISFPQLSLDDNCFDTNASSAPSSQASLITQPNQSCDRLMPTSVVEEDVEAPCPDDSLSRSDASPTKFDSENVVTESENQVVSDNPSYSGKSDTETSCWPPFQNQKVNSYLQNVTHIPIPMGNEMISDHREPKTPIEHVDECEANDPPVVSRLVRTGFKRNKVLALHKSTEGNGEKSDDTLICQLCNWNDLEDKGFEQDVCLAAVTYAPNDLEKATKFGKVVSELLEMGFPFDSVISAVRSSNMIKEKAVMHLLDPNGSSTAVPQAQRQDSPRIQAQGVGWRGKKKKPHIHLRPKH